MPPPPSIRPTARRRLRLAWLTALVGMASLAIGAEPPPAPAAPVQVTLPPPPLPPIAPPGPPPADPAASLYRAPGSLADGYLLTLEAEPRPPVLKSGKPTTLEVRPHDVVQAPGDPKPIEGTIDEEADGLVRFRDLKGIAHPKNPLRIADLLVFRRRAGTLAAVVRERSAKAADDPDAHLALAQDCLDADLLAEAEGELRRAIGLAPRRPDLWLKLADLCLGRGQRDAEVAALAAAVAAKADSPEVRERLGRRCLEFGLFHLAEQHFARGVALAAKLPDDAGPVDKAAAGLKGVEVERLLRLLAEARLLSGRAAEAVVTLKRLPENAAVANALAVADILGGQAEAALAALRKAAEAPDAPVSARNNLGAALFNSGDIAGALAHFEACRAAAPSHAKATANAALACAALGRLEEAQKLIASLRPPPGTSLGYWLAAGYVAEQAGNADAALAAYQQARKLDGGCFHAVAGVGRARLGQGDAKGAAEAFGDALALAPGDAQALRGLGACCLATGEFAAAADVFRKLAGDARGTPHDLLRLAAALLRLPEGRKEAEGLVARALAAAQPPDPYALALAGCLAATGGAADGAEDLLRQARRAKAPDVAKYAAAALERLLAARGEEATLVAFGAGGASRLPDGWRATGEGSPTPQVLQDELRFEGAPAAANERGVATVVPFGGGASEKEKGPDRRFARFEVVASVPLTNEAAVGIALGMGQSTLQVALRTTRGPQLSRRLAYRIVRGPTPAAWAELPGTIAVEQLRLGIGLSVRAKEALDIYLGGKPVGDAVPFDALAQPGSDVTVGVFVAAEPQQQCLFSVYEAELVWKR